MVSTDELNRLMAASVENPDEEPAFFRALLDATLYAHAPLDDPSENLRLVMFKSPDDGHLVIPMFTDVQKAEFAARGKVRIVEGTGRTLLEGTRGASVMFNPNDARCTLYPEEIAELLATGTVAPVRKDTVNEGEAQPYKLDRVPTALAKAMKKSLPQIQGVATVYVAGQKWQRVDYFPDTLLIVLGGRAEDAEREVRAVATALHRVIQRLDRLVDMMHFDGEQPVPDWIRQLGLRPVYRRRLGPPAPISKYH